MLNMIIIICQCILVSLVPVFVIFIVGQGLFIAHYGIFMLNPIDWPDVAKGLLFSVWSGWNLFFVAAIIHDKFFS